jgi:hypothetical protein
MARTKESEGIAAATASNARNKSTVVGFWPRVPFLRTRTNVFGAVQKPKAPAPKAALPIEPPVANRKRTADDGTTTTVDAAPQQEQLVSYKSLALHLLDQRLPLHRHLLLQRQDPPLPLHHRRPLRLRL